MELKQPTDAPDIDYEIGSNRTFMELKPYNTTCNA